MDKTQPVQETTITNSQDNNWAIAIHLSALVLGVLGPLILWLIKKDESEFIDYHGKEALNFQISIIIYAVASTFLVFLLIGFFLIFGVVILNIVGIIMAAVKANKGERYRYPLSLRLIK